MRVLITGIKGFIGSHVAKRILNEDDIQIIGLDNGYTATDKMLDGISIIQGDIANYEDIEKCGKCDVVIHCAGILGTNEIAEMGIINKANSVNINGTVNILEYCRKHNAKHIFATKPNPEDWMNPYTITKQAAENYCQMYWNEYKVTTIALSLLWVYGKEQRQEPVNKFVPTFMKYAIENKSVPIWNTGEQIIDCCYIEDIAEAFYRAMKSDYQGYIKLDVGTGVPVTVNEVANMVIKLVHSNSELEYIGKRLGEPVETAIVADTSHTKRLFDYVPSTTLEDGLLDCKDWFIEQFSKE